VIALRRGQNELNQIREPARDLGVFNKIDDEAGFRGHQAGS